MRGDLTLGSSHTPVTVLTVPDFQATPAVLSRWLGLLPSTRQAAIAGWPDPGARRRSLLGACLLSEGLRGLGYARQALASLRHSRHGRPSLDLPVEFSLSYCEGRVACALSTAGAVGIDVEPAGSVTAVEFRRYLDEDERRRAGADPRRFAEIWTRKEAVVKAAGSEGLRAVPRVRTGADDGTATLDGRPFRTLALQVGGDHVAHLAYAAAPDEPAWRVRLVSLEAGDLEES
jgi:4'-phosphopantetheinyl transferase